MKIKDIMQRAVFTVRDDTDIHTLARLLTERHISGAPVLNEDNQVVGVVSLHDLANHQKSPDEGDTAAYWHGSPHMPRTHGLPELRVGTPVRDIMTPAVHCLSEEGSLRDACDFFLLGQLHRVLVTRDSQLVGILTSTDLVRVFRDFLGAESDARDAVPGST